jgi:hypothetical protein
LKDETRSHPRDGWGKPTLRLKISPARNKVNLLKRQPFVKGIFQCGYSEQEILPANEPNAAEISLRQDEERTTRQHLVPTYSEDNMRFTKMSKALSILAVTVFVVAGAVAQKNSKKQI